jgi:aspartyl protease family protein
MLIWFLLIAALGLGTWKLSETFPDTIVSDIDRANLYYTLAIIAAVLSGIVVSRQVKLGQAVRDLATWASVIAVLTLGYSFRTEVTDVWQRVLSNIMPGEPMVTGANEIALTRSADGHFYAFGEANGMRIRFLIDTGATDTVISPADAVRIGIDAKDLRFTRPYGTANGQTLGAPYTLALLTIGPIEIADMPISVNQARMDSSLLGMSFLSRLASFEVRGDRMFMRRK